MRTANAFVPFFYLSKTAWHTINFTSRRPGILHVILIGGTLIPTLEKIYPEKRFSQWHTRNIPALNKHSNNGTEIFKVPLDSVIFTRSYEVFTRSVRDRDIAKAWQQGSFLLFPSLLYASLITSTLQFDSLLYSSVYGLSSNLLFSSTLSSV